MRTINSQILQAGDIVLTTSSAKVSAYIRTFTGSDISHAMICVEGWSVIDANSEGVQARNTQRQIFDDDCVIYILRPRYPLTPEQLKGVIEYVRQHVGTEYSTGEAVKTFFGGGADFTRKQFCSRLVAQAYASVDVQLVPDPNYCSPQNIKDSPLLVSVEPSWREVSAAEAAAWEKNDDATQRMRDATNALLKAARTRNPKIQSINDLSQHVIDHPEDDDFVLDAYRSSGYLTLWHDQKEKNPWLYDLGKMQKAPEDQMIDYCRRTVADEEAGANRFIINHGAYVEASQRTGLKTFAVLQELYGILATGQRTRVNVAKKYLEGKGLRVPEAPTVLEPHTPEWFAALEVWNPVQANHTKAAIAAMGGNTAVCSMCGDDPAQDYQLPPAQHMPGGVFTLRLCDDCLILRRRQGEAYEALEAKN